MYKYNQYKTLFFFFFVTISSIQELNVNLMGTFILSYLQTKRYGKEALTEDEKKGKMFPLNGPSANFLNYSVLWV